MQVESFNIKGPLLLTPARYEDDRGWFTETFNAATFADAVGRDVTFVQDNESHSLQSGTLRGLHFQHPPFAQGKLVRCTRGAIIDVAVDIREDSPTLGQHVKVKLDDKTGQQFWIPEGFAHGFVTRQNNTRVAYKCTFAYAPQAEGTIVWNDPLLHIDWEVSDPILSDKDRRAPGYADFVTPLPIPTG